MSSMMYIPMRAAGVPSLDLVTECVGSGPLFFLEVAEDLLRGWCGVHILPERETDLEIRFRRALSLLKSEEHENGSFRTLSGEKHVDIRGPDSGNLDIISVQRIRSILKSDFKNCFLFLQETVRQDRFRAYQMELKVRKEQESQVHTFKCATGKLEPIKTESVTATEVAKVFIPVVCDNDTVTIGPTVSDPVLMGDPEGEPEETWDDRETAKLRFRIIYPMVYDPRYLRTDGELYSLLQEQQTKPIMPPNG